MRHCAFALILLGACGGGDTPTSTAPASTPTEQASPSPAGGAGMHGEHGGAGEHPEQGEHGGHGKLTPELDAFHDILAPRWHADPGPDRVKSTCAAVADFRSRAAAVKSASAPAGADASAWSTAGADLEKSVTGLEAACGGDPASPDGKSKFDAAFSAVHDAFHRAMELAAGGHGKGEGHAGHGKGEHKPQ